MKLVKLLPLVKVSRYTVTEIVHMLYPINVILCCIALAVPQLNQSEKISVYPHCESCSTLVVHLLLKGYVLAVLFSAMGSSQKIVMLQPDFKYLTSF